jgi:hypothetical protein
LFFPFWDWSFKKKWVLYHLICVTYYQYACSLVDFRSALNLRIESKKQSLHFYHTFYLPSIHAWVPLVLYARWPRVCRDTSRECLLDWLVFIFSYSL